MSGRHIVAPEDLPSFLGARAPADASDTQVAAKGETGGATPAANVLPGVRMIGQLADNWCWSAVTQTVIEFFKGVSPRQDEIATAHVKFEDGIVCTPDGENRSNGQPCGESGSCLGHCNDPHRVRVVLGEHGRFRDTLSTEAPPTFTVIKSEINAKRPVVCRVAWNDGGGHFVLVFGWSVDAEGTQRVHVLDPKFNEGGEIIPPRVLRFGDFANRYTLSNAEGSINFSYRVQ